MRSLTELIAGDSAWPLVNEWLADAEHPVEVLAAGEDIAAEALLAVQVTTRSPMGAVILNSAGILVDSGWLRFLGSGGHPRLERSLPQWNEGRAEGFCICADDVAGGFFALNGGALGAQMGEVFYFAPDTLEWMALGIGYSDFFAWSLSERLEQFYVDLRWPGWREDVERASLGRRRTARAAIPAAGAGGGAFQLATGYVESDR